MRFHGATEVIVPSPAAYLWALESYIQYTVVARSTLDSTELKSRRHPRSRLRFSLHRCMRAAVSVFALRIERRAWPSRIAQTTLDPNEPVPF